MTMEYPIYAIRKKIASKPHFSFLKKFNIKEYERLFIYHNLNSDELLFTNKKIISKNFKQ